MIREREVFLRPWNLSWGTAVVAQLPHNLTDVEVTTMCFITSTLLLNIHSKLLGAI
jgi:hypothetical protein